MTRAAVAAAAAVGFLMVPGFVVGIICVTGVVALDFRLQDRCFCWLLEILEHVKVEGQIERGKYGGRENDPKTERCWPMTEKGAAHIIPSYSLLQHSKGERERATWQHTT